MIKRIDNANMSRRFRRSAPALGLVVAGFLTIAAGAMYVRLEVENVPVDRLVTNMEALVAASPTDARLKFNLARVHAMAFVSKKSDVPILKKHEKEGVWFGNEPANVPFGRIEPGRPEQQAAARAHLEKAIALYAEAIAGHQVPTNPVVPNERTAEHFELRAARQLDLTMRLGYAWCIEQSGDRTKAIAEYRDVLTRAWAVEEDKGPAALWAAVTPEAFSYLRPLLDREKDSAELALWDERAKRISRMPRAVTPIAIPLRDDMTIDDVVAPEARVRFDADGTGRSLTWTWIQRDAGWLVYDQRGTKNVTSALQWFGSVTFWMFWDNGYEPLRALDDNRDGLLDGRELEHLAIWRDRNQDGVTDPGEFASLSEWKIDSLSCEYEVPDDARVAAMSRRGVTFTDGRVRPTWDVILRAHVP